MDRAHASRIIATWLLAGLLSLAFSLRAASPPALIDLGTLGGSWSYAEGINAFGQVAGGSALPGDVGEHAFVWDQDNGMLDLGTIGDFWSSAGKINDAGQVMGFLNDETGIDGQRGMFWDPELGMQDLGTLGRTVTPMAINNAGQIVGYSVNADGYQRAFLWDSVNGMQDLGTLGGNRSTATDINDSGQVVGYSDTSPTFPENPLAFVWDVEHGMRDLGTLGGTWSQAFAVNVHGQVVGHSQIADGQFHAFLWDENRGMQDLGTLGGANSSATGINARGQVIGGWQTPEFGGFAFVWDEIRGMRAISLSGSQTSARSISDAGQVVGWGKKADDVHLHAFVWDPVNGILDLGNLNGIYSRALAINDLGQIVGESGHGFFAAFPKPPLIAEPFIGLGALPGHELSHPWVISETGLAVFGASGTMNVGYWLWRSTPESGMINLGVQTSSFDDLTFRCSPDGSVLLGESEAGMGRQVFRWTEPSGFAVLDTLPGHDPNNSMYGRGNFLRFASRDRQVFAGVSYDIVDEGNEHESQLTPWRWTPSAGLTPIPLLPGAVGGEITGLSDSGDAVCGYSWTLAGRLFWRWSTADGLQALNEEPVIGIASGISGDGKVIVGQRVVDNTWESWRWTVESGIVGLEEPFGYPELISFDGSVIVGSTQGKVWRWSSTGGSTVLDILPGYQSWPQRMSRDGNVIVGSGTTSAGTAPWRWTSETGTEIIGTPGNYSVTGYPIVSAMSADGSVLVGYELFSGQTRNIWRWTEEGGYQLVKDQFGVGIGWNPDRSPFLARDGSVMVGRGSSPRHPDGETWVAAYRPVISSPNPRSSQAGSAELEFSIYGLGLGNATVLWDGQELPTFFSTDTEIRARVAASLLQTSSDIETVTIQLSGPEGILSNTKGFTLLQNAGNVAEVQSEVVEPGTTSTVSIPPSDASGSGVTATFTNQGDDPANVTVAMFEDDPSPTGASFEVAGAYMDVNVNGATLEDSLDVFFYYPEGADAGNLALRFYNVATASWEDVSPVVNNTAERRFEVRFDANSHPSITELTGTYFAQAQLPPIVFTGFLAPIGGADDSGGSPSNPLRTFRAGSTIPIRFTATRGGSPVLTGSHTLRVIKYSDSVGSDIPIDATPQDAATTGNEFRLADGQWRFNLDTRTTGMDTGTWQIVATLSNGTEHRAWIQLK